jgi:hypothetical protein
MVLSCIGTAQTYALALERLAGLKVPRERALYPRRLILYFGVCVELLEYDCYKRYIKFTRVLKLNLRKNINQKRLPRVKEVGGIWREEATEHAEVDG